MELISHEPDFSGLLRDKRLEQRAKLISHSLLLSKSSTIHSATRSEAEQKGFYRFLGNDSVSESDLIREMTARCKRNVGDREVIVIQDSSSLGLSRNANNVKQGSGLGLVGNKTGLGFLSHVSIVLDANNESILGFCDVQLWHRKEDKSNNTTRVYKSEAIESKESYKWIKASKQAKDTLSSASHLTIIQDREGDIYEQFALIPDDKTSLIIRSRDNRRLADGNKLYAVLEAAPVLGTYTIDIQGDIRKNQVQRKVELEAKCMPVTLQKPRDGVSQGISDQLNLYAVEVREKGNTTRNAICWRLLTNMPVHTFEDALHIVGRYGQRWYIEQLFRLLKKQGYQIENCMLETGWAIRKLFVLVLNAALRVMQLYLAYGKEDCQPIEEVFNKEEIECLQAIEKSHLSKTTKTCNPYDHSKLSWASWIIARLGGWKGNSNQRAAGPIIIKRGLDKFETMFQGWQLHLDTS